MGAARASRGEYALLFREEVLAVEVDDARAGVRRRLGVGRLLTDWLLGGFGLNRS